MLRAIFVALGLLCVLLGSTVANGQSPVSLPGLPAAPERVAVPQVFGIDEDDLAVRAKLKSRISIDLPAQSLERNFEQLAKALHVDILLDPAGLEEAGVTRDMLCDPLSFKGKRGEQVLRLLLPPTNLDYYVKEGALIISSGEKCAERLVTRAYNVRDLIQPWIARPVAREAVGPLPIPDGARIMAASDVRRSAWGEDYDTVIDMVTSTVAPDSWTDNGGSGSITGFRGLLVISQTEAIHQEVEDLLKQVRAGERSEPGDVIYLGH
jgi:general secretion pathway protein D